MKTAKYLLLSLLVSSVGISSAVTLPFEVDKPEVRLVYSENGVNVRQQPSASAKKMIYMEEEADFGASEIDVAKWSSTVPRGYVSLQFYGPAPVVKESAGWYEIKDLAPQNQGNGWVSAKYCKPFTPSPLVYPETYGMQNSFRWIDNDYAIVWESAGGSSLDFVIIYIGKVVDGWLVCPYALGTEDHPVIITPAEDGQPTKILPPGAIEYYPHEWVLAGYDLSEINGESVKVLLENALPIQKPRVFYRSNYDFMFSFSE